MHEPIRRRDAAHVRAAATGLLTAALASLAAAFLATLAYAPAARAACDPAVPEDDDAVTCTGTSTGYDGSGADNLTITTSGAAVLAESSATLDSAILVEDESSVTIGQAATVRVTEQGGFGIRGDDDNFLVNSGRIELLAEDAIAIALDQNTTGVLPNGAVNSGTIQVDGDGGIAIRSGDNTGTANSGIINLVGDGTRGLSAANRTDETKPSDITNEGEINVEGDDSFGIRVGDGWTGTRGDVDGNPLTPSVFTPNLAAVRNTGTITVSGDRSTGLFLGDEDNTQGNHDSNASNVGTIDVTGTDAIGISLGGNDRETRFDISPETMRRLTNRPSVDQQLSGVVPQDSVAFENGGTLEGGADAGPLVEVRDFFGTNEIRLINAAGGRILADPTNAGDPDRYIAIRGSDGMELVVNAGTIEGAVELAGGDDRFVQRSGAVFDGTISGGAGDDELILTGTRAAPDTFDLADLDQFEVVRIMGVSGTTGVVGTPWQLANADDFAGLLAVLEGGILDVPTPITLGGSLELDDDAIVAVTLDGTTPPLTIEGAATFDGTLAIRQGTNLTPSATPYRVILANGGYTGEFAEIVFPNASATRRFTASYDPMGILALFEDIGLVGAARGANQRAIAGNLQDMIDAGGASGDLQTMLDEIEETGNPGSVYDALSPEAYDAQTTVSVEAGRRIAALLFDRPRECETGEVDPWQGNHRVLPCHARRIAPWAATVGSFRNRDANSGHPRYDAQLGGLVAGVDFQPIAGLDLTLAFSSQRGGIDVARAGESTLTLAELTGAAAWSMGGLRVQGVVSWGHGFHQDRRRVEFDETDTPVDVRGLDDHESDRTLLATEIGYRIPAGPVGIEPLFGFDWAFMSQDGIEEDEAGGYGLDVDDRDDEIGSLRAGVRLSTVYEHKAYLGPWFEWATGIWRPSFDVAWRQFVEGNERDLDARLQGSPASVGGFTVQGEEDEGGAEIGVGLRLVPKDANRLRFDVRYQAYVAENTLEQDLVGQIAIAF